MIIRPSLLLVLALTLTLLPEREVQAAVTPSIELHPYANQYLELQLCFHGSAQRLHFDLHIHSLGRHGRSRSRQRGQLQQLDHEKRCPVQLRFSDLQDRTLQLRLEWSLDGVQQAPLLRSVQLSAVMSQILAQRGVIQPVHVSRVP